MPQEKSNIYVDPATGNMQQGQSGSFTVHINDYNPPAKTADEVNKNPSMVGDIKPNIPDSGTPTADSLLKDIQTPMGLEDIRATEAARKAEIARQAEALFAPKITEAKATGELNLGSARGQLGESRGLGFSSAEASYIGSIQKEIDNRVSEIEKAKEDYIANGNFKAWEAAENSIAQLREFNNNLLIKKAELTVNLMQEKRAGEAQGLAEKKFAYDVEKEQRDFEVGQERFDRTQAVQEGWLMRSLTEDDKKQSQENIISMANSGIQLDQITDEQRTELETKAGYEPGSFEAIYNRAFDQARLGDTMDMLKLNQLQTQVTKSKQSGGGAGGGKTKLEGIDKDLDIASNMIISAEKLGGGQASPDSYWNQVNKISEAWGMSSADVDSMLINTINQKKGITFSPEDLGSNFVIGDTTDTDTAATTTAPLGIEGAKTSAEAVGMVVREFPEAGRQIQAEINRRNIQSLKDTVQVIKEFFGGLTK